MRTFILQFQSLGVSSTKSTGSQPSVGRGMGRGLNASNPAPAPAASSTNEDDDKGGSYRILLVYKYICGHFTV